MLLSHKSEDPIEHLKIVCGDEDPQIAKNSQPNSLRAKYGEDIVKNGVYCSEDAFRANKDRDIFYFPIP
jgi:nucleoside diphosphate kinase